MNDVLQHCPVCGCTDHAFFLAGSIDHNKMTGFSYASRKEPEFMNFPYVECPTCDLVYTPAPPTAEELKRVYRIAKFDSFVEADFAAKTYLKLLKPWINALPKRECAVDIGAGTGALLPLLRREGFKKVMGIEPSLEAIMAASPEAKEMLRGDFFSEELLECCEPDLIFTAMTLEHVRDPLEMMKAVRKNLSPGGFVAVVMHNRRAPLNRALGKRSPIIDVEHLQLFSPKSREQLFRKAGLEPLSIKSFSNRYPLRYWVRLLPLPVSIKRRLLKSTEKTGLSGLSLTLPVGNLFGVART